MKIEYPPSLILDMRGQGILYGEDADDVIRLISIEAQARPVGIFSVRERGEVFMDESDLERFEISDARVALIIAGESAGFFVRQGDGSIQSIRSHEEIPAPVSQKKWRWKHLWNLLAILLLLTSAATWNFRAAPLALLVREDSGQLRIGWRSTSGRIEIEDGGAQTVAITPAIAALTYVPRTGDVTIRLIAGRRFETARYLGHDPIAGVKAEIAALENEAGALAAQSARQRARIADLRKTLSTMKRVH